ncbi:tyrosine--tRNA ligase [Candidatus Mycoplasma haematohominis]|uniref:Tyrosine--tRNA ligase n=1 Tax=Candidatus Mycoplasma haematohominis TaxID=1494318 RepID=A0A478FQK8_9MOLU|nr:tyrosine--tRNA ligase [Candidatus Mycoplasma haemohominis]
MKEHKDKLKQAEDFFKDLEDRGLIYKSTWKDGLIDKFAKGKRIYWGIDPTADFLHLGHYLGLSFLKRFTKRRYPIVVLIGSLTARIGDPSFRSKARKFNPDIDNNAAVLKEQLSRFFEKEMQIVVGDYPLCEIVDNYELHNDRLKQDATIQEKPINALLGFIGEACSCLKVNELIRRDAFANRLDNGLTLAEFLYPSLQGLDFFYLNKEKGVDVQLGGSDQWGNMLVGLQLMTKDLDYESNEAVNFKKAGVITFPLLTDSYGNKFGKSEGNAISINTGGDNKNIYSVRQYLLNVNDDMVHGLFLKLTHLSIEEIDQINKEMSIKDQKNRLADVICEDIFGNKQTKSSSLIIKQAFSGELALERDYEALKEFGSWVPSKDLRWMSNMRLSSIFIELDLVSSNSEFNRLRVSGGVYVPGIDLEELEKSDYMVKEEYVVWDKKNPLRGILTVRKGKKHWGLIHFSKNESVFS